MADIDRLSPRPGRSHFALFAVAWTVFAVYGSLVPLHYQPTAFSDALQRFENLPPLWFGIGTRADWVANILLFIPLTFLWMGALACDRGPVARAAAGLAVVPLAAAASVALEFTQIWFPGRTVSRNDIVAESLGAVVGVLAWVGVGQHVVNWLRTYAGDRSQPSQIRWLLQAYLLGFLIVSVLPLDLTISLTEIYHKYQRGQVLLIPFTYHYESLAVMAYQFFADIMVFVPVGAWLAITERDRATGRSLLLVGLVGGAIIAAAIEFAQLLVLSRFTNVTDVILGTVGSGIGAWLVVLGNTHAVSRPDPIDSVPRWKKAMPWLVAIVGYSLFLVVGFWFPFEFSRDGALVRARLQDFLYRVPFLSLYRGTEFNAIDQLLIRVLLFAPLGAMWAYVAALARTRPARRLLASVGFVYTACLAFGIEAVEVFMPSKVADSTEVFLCAAGALIGLYATLRLLAPGDTRTGSGATSSPRDPGARLFR